MLQGETPSEGYKASAVLVDGLACCHVEVTRAFAEAMAQQAAEQGLSVRDLFVELCVVSDRQAEVVIVEEIARAFADAIAAARATEGPTAD